MRRALHDDVSLARECDCGPIERWEILSGDPVDPDRYSLRLDRDVIIRSEKREQEPAKPDRKPERRVRKREKKRRENGKPKKGSKKSEKSETKEDNGESGQESGE